MRRYFKDLLKPTAFVYLERFTSLLPGVQDVRVRVEVAAAGVAAIAKKG